MRQRLVIQEVMPDGRVVALSEDGVTSLTCKPDPMNTGWTKGDALDVLAAPTTRSGGGSLVDKLPPIPGVPKPREG